MTMSSTNNACGSGGGDTTPFRCPSTASCGLWWRRMLRRLPCSSPCSLSWLQLPVWADMLEGPYGAECGFILHATAILMAATTLRTAHSMVRYYGESRAPRTHGGVSSDSVCAAGSLSPPPSHFAAARGESGKEEADGEGTVASDVACLRVDAFDERDLSGDGGGGGGRAGSPTGSSSPSSRTAPHVPSPSAGKTRAARCRLLRYWQLVQQAVLRDEGARTKVGSVVLHVDLARRARGRRSSRKTATSDTDVDDDVSMLPLDDAEATANLLLSSREQLLVLAASDSDARCFSPKTSGTHADGGEDDDACRALRHIWEDTIRYDVNPDEILSVLLAYDVGERLARGSASRQSPAVAPSREVREAAARLALLWYLALLRTVYEAVAQRRDTEGSEDELSALRTHAARLYDRCLTPLLAETKTSAVDDDYDRSCHIATCWQVLRAGESSLRRRRHRLMLSNTWYLFRYMYDSSHGKLASAAMLFIMTRGAGLLNAAGTYLRDSVSNSLTAWYDDTASRATIEPADACGETRCGTAAAMTADAAMSDVEANFAAVVVLCSVELMRLVLNTIVLSSTQQFIRSAASRRRDGAKKELYEALTHMPLAFYDLHAYDEVEEMVYYVNDLEGVDVHIHQYVWQTASNYLAMTAALAPLPRDLKYLVAATVLTSLAVKGVGAMIAGWYHVRLRDGSFARWFPWSVRQKGHRHTRARTVNDDEEMVDDNGDDEDALTTTDGDGASDDVDDDNDNEDLQESENRSSNRQRDGIMLRGLEIIAALPSLRPYGAEVGMMAWWNQHNGGRRRLPKSQKTGAAFSEGRSPSTAPRPWYKRVTRRQLSAWFFQYVPLSFLVRNAKVSVWLPVLGASVMNLVDWLLPVVVSAYGAASAAMAVCLHSSNGSCGGGGRRGHHQSATPCSSPAWSTGAFRLLGAMEATRQWVSSLLDAGRVLEVVLRNGYKASVLARLRDPRYWEPSADTLTKSVVAASHPAAHSSTTTTGTTTAGTSSTTTGTTTENDAPRLTDSFYMGNSVLSASMTYAGHQTARLLAHEPAPRHAYAAWLGKDSCAVRHIRVRGLQFRYPTAPTVNVYPEPLSLDLRLFDTSTGKGRFVCLVGPSGCGKSTLLSLLLGLYRRGFQAHTAEDSDSPARAVRTDPITLTLARREAPSSMDVDIALGQLPPDVLRASLFSFVPQYPTIFGGATIAHNISLQDFISLEEVEVLSKAALCAGRAQCAEFIDRFPQGLLTRITDAAGASTSADCVRLSGGQAQRLMMARALYHSSGILLMDEPTASLDVETKEAVLKEYRTLLASGAVQGILCSTHDPAVMSAADEVVHCGRPHDAHD